ncbi:MAG: peptidoglycan DD-metalloendopeptidase family protein [Elainellaceae cyanobacterium]
MASNTLQINPAPSRRLVDPYAIATIGSDTFVLGDGHLKSITVTLAEGEEASSCEIEIYDPGRKFANKYFTWIEENDGLDPLVIPSNVSQTSRTALEALQKAEKPAKERAPKPAVSEVGQQITIELGFAGETISIHSFLHVGLDFDMFSPDRLLFKGASVNWVLAQRIKNTAYTNLSLRQIAQKICDAHGLTLDMEGDGPHYEYFPQRGQSDYEALLIEARRIGYRVHTRGRKLILKPRQADSSGFVLEYGSNMGVEFSVRHQAQSGSSGGARASAGGDSNSTGEAKFVLDSETGAIEQNRSESLLGAGEGATQFTTGSHIKKLKPVTDGNSDDSDRIRRENELRIKGIIANFSLPTSPEALILNPDSIFSTLGISEFLDRVWVIESISHAYRNGKFLTTGTCYTPLKNKYPQATPVAQGASIPGKEGFLHPLNGSGVLTSGYRTASRPNHNGIDLGAPTGIPVYASKDGTVTDTVSSCQVGQSSCGGRYGNRIFLSHPDGSSTRYAHLSAVHVSNGQSIKQGEEIGLLGNTGDSTGPHLHFEIRFGGSPDNPLKYISV